MIKNILILCMIAIVIVGSMLYGYKLGIDDSASLIYFSEVGLDYAHLKALEEKGADNLREFIESDLDLAIPIYKELGEKQSIFSKIMGPESIRNANREHYLSYYRGILEYKKKYPSKDKESKVLVELEQLINQLEDK